MPKPSKPGIGGLLRGIFGGSHRAPRLTPGEVAARQITQTVADRIAADLGKSLGGKVGSSIGRTIVRDTMRGIAPLADIDSSAAQKEPTGAPQPVQAKQTEKAKPATETLEQCLQELRSLIGLSSVKKEVETLINLAKVFALRKQKQLPVPEISFHLIFSGNPGTGKTIVARIISRVFAHLKLLSKGHLVELDRSGLVANYVGQTATKTKEVVEKAKGGILFIDEAYALAEGGPTDYGHEAIETLLKAMEDDREDLVVIAAGYTNRMESFLASNPGLRSRFSHVIAFPDYSPSEMVEIFALRVRESEYRLSDDAKEPVVKRIEELWERRSNDFANARDVRNLFERVISMQANRVAISGATSADALMTITEADVRTALG